MGVTTSKNTSTETPKHQPKASKQGVEMNESVVDGYADLVSKGVGGVCFSKQGVLVCGLHPPKASGLDWARKTGAAWPAVCDLCAWPGQPCAQVAPVRLAHI